MADEKILEEELLDEEDLDGVAGGTKAEVNDDRARLMKMGVYQSAGPHSKKVDNVKASFAKLGSNLGVNLDVGVEGHYDGTANKYFINGLEVSRKTLWDFVDDVYARNKK